MSSMIPWSIIEAALPTLEPVSGGYTRAQRGVVTLTDGQKVFVKAAVDEQTKEWIQKERKAYDFLAVHNFRYAPQLVAETDGGIAMADLSAWDWSKTWTKPKIDAVFKAMDALAPLGIKAQGIFGGFDLEPQVWSTAPTSVAAYDWAHPLASIELLQGLAALIENRELTSHYARLAAVEPWAGTDLIHNDIRSDNFAFNSKTGEGLLVDWNWLCLGAQSFDASPLLVDMEQAGADITSYLSRCDTASLAYVVGYWLNSAAEVPDSENLVVLRLHQLESALTAHHLLQQLLR